MLKSIWFRDKDINYTINESCIPPYLNLYL